MLMEEIIARKKEIESELRGEVTEERLNELTAEVDALEAEEKLIKEAAEARSAEIEAVVNDKKAEEVEIPKTEEKTEERKMFDRSTPEYRNAFMAHIVGKETEEQRAILADNSAYGDGVALPTALDDEIWNQVVTAHPILGDVAVLRSGIAIKVTQMTPAAVSKKMDSAASTELSYITAEVVLVGADYHTYIGLSYAEAKMSQGAMEAYLVKDIADNIGEALAKDIFARILTDATTAQKVASTSDMFDDLQAALGKAVLANRPVVYAPATEYYKIVGCIKQGSPFNAANTLGCECKLDNAATKVTVVDPSLFVLNIIQDTTVESDRDVTNAKINIGGYMRAEGCLRKTKAAAYID